jgi:hypothetical protein
MHIYVDESGSFVPSGTKAGISLVGALVIPDGRKAKIFSKYAALRSRLPKHVGEVKGRLLNEDQVAEVVELLRRNEALLEIVAIDLNTHEPAEIEASKRELAESMTRGLTDAHHPSVLAGAASLAKRINELTHPLFVQSTVMFELIRHVAEVGINSLAATATSPTGGRSNSSTQRRQDGGMITRRRRALQPALRLL